MNRFLLVTNSTKDPDGLLTKEAIRIIAENGGICTAAISRKKPGSDEYSVIDPSEVPAETELIISLGGDGSFLHTAKELSDLHIPIMGINLGNLGYLTEMDLDGFSEEFSHITDGDYHIEERILLKGSLIREGNVIFEDIAVNDIVLNRLGSMDIINFDVKVNNRFLNSYNADGFIISSPTGSTGYNLSAGGPVADPGSQLLIATPICEHTLNSRSLIFAADVKIDIIPKEKPDSKKQIKAISFDGNEAIVLQNGDMLRVERSEKNFLNLRMDKLSFVEHLGKKMRKI